jgi:two-component system, OmpR family, response regulator
MCPKFFNAITLNNLNQAVNLIGAPTSIQAMAQHYAIFTEGSSAVIMEPEYFCEEKNAVRLLIVEDELDLLRALAKTFREEGYAVDTASDGEEGLFKATNWDYDAIVLDLMLPKLDGGELLKRLRRIKKTPVLVLTARDALPDRVKGLDTGADDYLVKPYERLELLARIRALVRRAAGQAVSVLEIGDVKIDMASRIVTRQGESINLTAREYALVEFLALHRGNIVTRTMLYEHLFDEKEDSLSNLLDVFVSKLRKKLGPGFVMTRRGQGYMIDV